MKTKKRKNPGDLTRRNNNARKKEIAALRKKVEALERYVLDIDFFLRRTTQYGSGVL